MKQLSKMMLAAVASVALAAPAFAWDFSASGSTSATWNQTTTTANSLAATKETSKDRVHGEGGSLAIGASHTDGAKTASVTYSLDWDSDLDESLTVSGSNKVGAWTASGSVSYDIQRAGCYATDNGTAASTAVTACAGTATGEDTTSVTLTNGTMTIVLGDAAHLSTQNVSSGGAAGGSVAFSGDSTGAGGAGMDTAPGAMVDSFHGVSLGYAINDTTTATVAYQVTSDAGDMLGLGAYRDGEVAGTALTTGGYTTTGTGVGVTTVAGPAAIGFTFGSATTASTGGFGTIADKKSTSMTTMGLGVTIDLGDIDPFISYGTFEQTGNLSKDKMAISGSEFGLTYALGADSIVVYVGNVEETFTDNSVAGKPWTTSGMEVGYSTTVGPAGLAIGYGSKTKAQTDNALIDGYSMTDIEIALTYSF